MLFNSEAKKLTINNYKMLLLGQNSKVCLERKATLHEKKNWIIVSNKTIVLRKIIEGYIVIMLNKIIGLICRLIEIKKNLKLDHSSYNYHLFENIISISVYF